MHPSISIALDRSHATGRPQLEALADAAATASIDRLWVTGRTGDPFEIAASWLMRRRDHSVTVGVNVAPMTAWASPADLAGAALRVERSPNQAFVLGVGLGHPTGRNDELERQPVIYARRYLAALKDALPRGSTSIPVYLAALGPRMIQVAGEMSDGIILNWCSRDWLDASRAAVRRAEAAAGRRPGSVRIVSQLRVVVDAPEAGRKALARQLVQMILRTPPENADRGYRAHARRLGLGDLFDGLAARQVRGATYDELAQEVPGPVIDQLAYAGPPAGLAAAIDRIAGSADEVMLRPVASAGSKDPVRDSLSALRS